jgi:hypothetical protein
VLLLFLAAIGFLGMLAFTRNSRHSEPDLISGDHLTIGLILVGCAIAAVASVICTRYKRLP